MKLGLEGRTELKYALPVARRGEVLAAAAGLLEAGSHGGPLSGALGRLPGDREHPPWGYRVHSLYLDSANLDGYAGRLAEADIRNRLRIRSYADPGQPAPVFLEAKRKLREHVVKHRVQVGDTEAWARGDAQQPWVDAVAALPEGPRQRLGRRWLAAVRAEAPLPLCVTHYWREVYEVGSARLTLDHHVRGSPARDPRHFRGPGEVPLLPADWLVLELKFNDAMPGWIRRLLATLRLDSEPVSKFALATVRTVRQDRPVELRYLTPPSVLRAAREQARRAGQAGSAA